jgi:serine O-acetyltransferase
VRFALVQNKKGRHVISEWMLNRLNRTHGVYIAPTATIGHGIVLKHPTGIVIGEGVILGDNATVYQQVTLGGVRMAPRGTGIENRYPKIGPDCILFAGAKILGPVNIGARCIIGANAVVISDVPDDHTAVGVPARMFPSRDISMQLAE